MSLQHKVGALSHSIGRFLYSVQRTVGVRNPWQAARYVLLRVQGAIGHGGHAEGPRLIEHPFDLEYGVKTSGLIAADPGDPLRHAYYGVSPSIIGKACQMWRESLPPGVALEDYTFIDLGAGMGRALLLASKLPFRNVVGVEFKSELVHIARHNIALWVASGQAKSSVEIIEDDVLHFPFPPGPLLIFLYNPFGEDILRRVLDRLPSVTRPDTIDILYIHPVFGFLFWQRRDFQKLWMKFISLDSRDANADAFRSVGETCAAYRQRPRSRQA